MYLSSIQLAARWHISTTTLSHWRLAGKGPPFLRFGNRVRYRIADIEEYEQQTTNNNNADND
jgi:allophanate hydrolase subunit 1